MASDIQSSVICSEEEWRPVLGYDGFYEVSSLGRVRSIDHVCKHFRGGFRLWKGRMIKQTKTKKGRLFVSLSKHGSIKQGWVQVLVCEAFHGARPNGKEVSHYDGITINNRADNLRWATHTENESDKRRHGTIATGLRSGRHTKPESTPRGEDAHKSHLTETDIVEIRNSPFGCYILSKKYSVSPTTIKCIRNRKTWRHVP